MRETLSRIAASWWLVGSIAALVIATGVAWAAADYAWAALYNGLVGGVALVVSILRINDMQAERAAQALLNKIREQSRRAGDRPEP